MSETPQRTALITGAGRGIGRAITLGLAEDGFDVVVNGSANRLAAEAVATEARAFGVQAVVAMGDVGQREDCARIAAEALARFGKVDVLVNNAALRPAKPFLEIEAEDWRRVMAVDLEAAVWLSQAVLPGMLHQGWGRVVNFTGMNAIHGYSGRAPVSAAKHGVWGLTKSLAKEFGARGVTVNAISPGPIASDGDDPSSDAHRQSYVAKVPAGRMGTPNEVAAVVRMLVGDGGAYVNGQMLQVNGGAET
ncbi:SDR family oxidoreductase [Roseomonas nepalensis]|uniref:SDR family oxidoreductase n=1 Tax=Muricoccus nepalensis TaxID=1854500 RepID=A0A502GAE4_9PROT|nr:3-oxoacyl-ACP reductase FabG [Roseomonas nepalensis]TPG58612.1 SDR family oxidoreductase [Roseomonas nepalensis]